MRDSTSGIAREKEDRMFLQEILDTMDVPTQRRTDLGWLSRNLHVRNADNPHFVEAQRIIRKALAQENRAQKVEKKG